MNWFFWICGILGALSCVSAGKIVRDTRLFLEHSEQATATVIEYEQYESEYDDGTDTIMYRLRLRMDLDGRKPLETVEEMGTSWQPYPVGTVLRVRFDPAKPEDFRVDATRRLYVQPKILFIFGVTLLMITFLFGVMGGKGDEVVRLPGGGSPEDLRSSS